MGFENCKVGFGKTGKWDCYPLQDPLERAVRAKVTAACTKVERDY